MTHAQLAHIGIYSQTLQTICILSFIINKNLFLYYFQNQSIGLYFLLTNICVFVSSHILAETITESITITNWFQCERGLTLSHKNLTEYILSFRNWWNEQKKREKGWKCHPITAENSLKNSCSIFNLGTKCLPTVTTFNFFFIERMPLFM